MRLPSQEELQELLKYDSETGRLTWLVRSGDSHGVNIFNSKYAGKEAFTSTNPAGYSQGHIYNRLFRAHRVIFKWMTGEEPEQIDHQNGDRQDNRWGNLRGVDRTANMRNVKRSKRNKSGVVGVDKHRATGRFRATIGGKHLGLFDSLEEATAVRKAAEITHNYHQNHGRAV